MVSSLSSEGIPSINQTGLNEPGNPDITVAKFMIIYVKHIYKKRALRALLVYVHASFTFVS